MITKTRRRVACFKVLFSAFFSISLNVGTKAQASVVVPDDLPAWTRETGARSTPKGTRRFTANTFGATGDGVRNSTRAIQQAIDVCSRGGGGIVNFKPGKYVTGALFLKSDVELLIGSGVTLLGSQDDADYPSIWTRVAGIEMNWPAALINVNDQHNVRISGRGTINGGRDKWGERYLEVRLEDDAGGLRRAADYDAERDR